MTSARGGRVLITAGPNRARLDGIRFIMNTSTGALGSQIAEECMRRGWPVDYVAGPFAIIPQVPDNDAHRFVLHSTPWQEDVLPAIEKIAERGETVAVFHVMAVLDFVPRSSLNQKRPSGRSWSITLVPTPKIIDSMRRLFPEALLVAFKLEMAVDETILQERAARLATQTHADLVVANLLDWVTDAGYRCIVIDGSGSVRARIRGRMQTATYLCDRLEEVRRNDGNTTENS